MARALRLAERAPGPTGALDTAFRDIHGPTLHGFALLLTLGDAALAARLASGALAAASGHAAELRHPERAAAWLRARVLAAAPRRDAGTAAQQRLASLAALGVGPSALAGLAALDHLERAALLATSVERLDRRDVSEIVDRDGPALDALLRRARRRFLAGATRAEGRGMPGAPGPTRRIVEASAARAMR